MVWRALADGPQPRTEVCVANLGPLFYVIGGYFNPSERSLPGAAGTVPWDLPTARADVYDAQKDAWTPLPDVPTATIDHCVAVGYDGWVYLFHGSAAWKIQPPANRWASIAPSPNSHDYGGYGEIGGKIYLTGGGSTKVDVYDPATASWETLAAEMPTARGHTSGAVVEGKLYVIGGDTGGHAVNTGANEMFDPSTGVWTSKAELPVVRGSLAATAYMGRIVVMGGQSGGGGGVDSFADVNVYDPAADSWSEGPTMTHPRHGFGAGAWEGRVYAFLGSPQQGVDATAKADVLEPAV